jgi:L-alanine-DL-glutamate epimerase-like enolase superfamily enzyme
MLIAAVDVDLVPLPAVAPSFAWRRGLRGSAGARETAVLRITTESGAVGEAYHEWSGPMLADIVDRVLREELVGERADRREWLWHRLWELDRTEEFPIWLIGVVDVALWDLEARVLGVPVHRLLGTYRESIPAYASTTTFATIEEYLDVADQCLDLGFSAIKLHGWGDARADADLCQQLRAHVGPDVDLMYDGSAGFDLPSAEYLGHALSEAGYRWYEEPMREFSITAYRWLADRVDVPLLVGETSDGSHLNTADFIVSGCATYVRTSANHRGGITGAMRIAHLADAFRLRAEVHGPTEPAVHLCMAVPNCTYYESLVTSNPATRESRVGPDGLVHAPAEPGIALPDFANEYRVRRAHKARTSTKEPLRKERQ